MLEVDVVRISVIVPIYNVKLYIERCVRSLMEQTLENIEFIFVNDCTPDDSMDILHYVLEEYPKRREQIKIIEQGYISSEKYWFKECDRTIYYIL